jgi:apolipoprotein D and lipocalin family protein
MNPGILSSIVACSLLTACFSQPVYRTSSEPLPTVASVDLSRYAGRWYEIHRLPNGFEDADCATVTADYSLRDDGLIRVVNSCVKADGVKRSTGVARVVDPTSRARLEVSFFRPFYGDYWIVDLTEDYSAVLVAEPAGKYLWILGRTPALPPEIATRMRQRAEKLGYPLDKLLSPANKLPSPPL